MITPLIVEHEEITRKTNLSDERPALSQAINPAHTPEATAVLAGALRLLITDMIEGPPLFPNLNFEQDAPSHKEKEFNLCKRALELGADPNTVPPGTSMTPLVIVLRSYPSLVDVFLQHGADPNLHSDANPHATPLNLAIESGNNDCVKSLLKFGADANGLSSKTPRAPLITAILADNCQAAQLLLDNGATLQANHPNGISLADILSDDNLTNSLQLSEEMWFVLKSYKTKQSLTAEVAGATNCADLHVVNHKKL